MRFIIILLVAFIVMLLLVLRFGTDRRIVRHKTAYLLFWISLIVLTLYGAIWFVFGINEISVAGTGKWFHLLPAVLVYGLGYLTWFRPLEGGVILSGCSLVAALVEVGVNGSFSMDIIQVLAFNVLPMLISGALLIIARFLVFKELSK